MRQHNQTPGGESPSKRANSDREEERIIRMLADPALLAQAEKRAGKALEKSAERCGNFRREQPRRTLQAAFTFASFQLGAQGDLIERHHAPEVSRSAEQVSGGPYWTHREINVAAGTETFSQVPHPASIVWEGEE